MDAALEGSRRYFADPALVSSRGRYYLFPTTDGRADWRSTGFEAFSSADLVDWTHHGAVLELGRDVTWADGYAWAPAFAERDGRCYLYFTAEDHIGVATADDPLGPFTDIGRPLVEAGSFAGRAIDPSVFRDDDGTAYLLWGNGVANIARLNDDMVSIDPATAVEWHHADFREAAHLHRRRDVYYLTWSENDTRDPEYRVCWASGPSPSGPWRLGGVLLEQDPAAGVFATGHHSILRVPGTDDWLIAYHRFAVPGGDGFHRELVIDPLHHGPDGGLLPVRPSSSALSLTSD